jgi:NADH:ubiquinone oxidoreductase subunit 2 (subunit N)
MLRDLAQVDERWVWLVVLASLGVIIAYLRALCALLRADRVTSSTSPTTSLPTLWLPVAVSLILSLAAIALGIFPNPVLRAASMLITLYPLPRL